MQYEKLIHAIVENVGSMKNVTYAGHCATRLRFKLADMNKLNKENLEKVPGVLGVRVQSGIEVQIIVGTDVLNIYAEFEKITGYKDDGSIATSTVIEKRDFSFKTIGTSIMNYLSGTVAPVIPIYLCAGMVLAVINICTAFLGVDANNSTISILNSIAIAGFNFMPIVLGWSAAGKLGADPALGAMLGMFLVFPEISGVEGLTFMGISVYPCTYTGSFLPIILGAAFLAMVYKFFRDKIPQAIRYFTLPLITMLISVPVTLLILGPAGYVLGTYLSVAFEWLGAHVRILAIALWSFISPIGVMTGIDKAVFFLNMPHLNTVGFDNIFLPGGLCGNAAIGGAALAVWFMSKDKETKSLGASSGITAIIGITEPALYGICVKLKTPLLGAMLGAVVGGVFAGFVNLKQYVYAGPGLMTAPVYFTDQKGGAFNFVMCFATIVVSAIAGFIMTYLISGRGKKINGTVNDTEMEMTLSATAKGEVLSMEKIPDEVFSQGTLGVCCGINPTEGKVYAPVSGIITMVSDTKHAIGIKGDNGVEVLIHVGLDTVEMNGDGFAVKVEEGKKVQRSEVLLKMDLDKIKAAGHPTVVITVVTNVEEYSEVALVASGDVMPGTDVFRIRK